MKSKKHLLAVFILMIFISSCTYTMGSKKIGNSQTVNQIQKSKSTKQDVTNLIGLPSTVSFNTNNEEIWTYLRTKSTIRATTFIPFVGIFVGGADTEIYQITIMFDQSGIVSSIGCGTTTGAGGGLQDLNR